MKLVLVIDYDTDPELARDLLEHRARKNIEGEEDAGAFSFSGGDCTGVAIGIVHDDSGDRLLEDVAAGEGETLAFVPNGSGAWLVKDEDPFDGEAS